MSDKIMTNLLVDWLTGLISIGQIFSNILNKEMLTIINHDDMKT